MTRTPPPPPGFDARAFARAAAPAIGLPLPEEAVEEVAANLERTAGFAALLMAVEGLEGEAPGPLFHPVEGAR